MAEEAEKWLRATPADRARAASGALGIEELASWCADVLTGTCDLLGAGSPESFSEAGAASHNAHAPPDPRWLGVDAAGTWGDPASWPDRGLDYWPRVWAARTLLHQWHPVAASAIRQGLSDPAWRVREMCAKVVARYEESIAADACARLAEGDSTPRVRVAALRALAVVGESEHAPVVLAALGDEERAVLDAAERALATIELRLDRRFDR